MKKELTPRKKQALEMRSRIQNVALELFDKEGFENVSVEQIAQAVGCSVGNIYHYFKSKDELVIQVTSSVDAQYSVLEESYLADEATPGTISCWTLWVRPWSSAPRTRPSTAALSTASAIPSRASCGTTRSACISAFCVSWWTGCKQEGTIHPDRDREELVADLVAPAPRYAAGVAYLRGCFRPAPPRPPYGRRAAGGLAARGVSKGIHRKGGADG